MAKQHIPTYGNYIIGGFILILVFTIGGIKIQSIRLEKEREQNKISANSNSELFYIDGVQVTEKSYGENQRDIAYNEAMKNLNTTVYNNTKPKYINYSNIPQHIKQEAANKARLFVNYQSQHDAIMGYIKDNYMSPYSSYADLFESKYKEYLDDYLKQYRYVLK